VAVNATRRQHARRVGRVVVCAALIVTASGCSTTVAGTAMPELASRTVPVTGVSDPDLDRPLPAALLLPPDRFPASYPAVTLPPPAVAQAAPDLAGIPVGARVEPPGCLPLPQNYGPEGTAIAVGTSADGRATISVEVVVPAPELAELKNHLGECGEVDATHRGATSTVTTVAAPEPLPPMGGVRTLAYTRTVVSGQPGHELSQSMESRGAQLGDARVLVTYMAFDDRGVDRDALDIAFHNAVVYAFGG
jgi:hypothetical protein